MRRVKEISPTTDWERAITLNADEGAYVSGSFYNPSASVVHIAIDGDQEKYYLCPAETLMSFTEDDQIKVRQYIDVRTASGTATNFRIELNQEIE